MTKSSVNLRRIAVSALLLSIALVLKTFFSLYIPLFGQNGISVGLSGIFSMLPSVLFGPFYGAAVSGLSDLMGYLLKPSGAYMPLLTLVAALGGFMRGALFLYLRKRKTKHIRIVVILCAVLLLAFGSYSLICLHADGVTPGFYETVLPQDAQTDGMHAISRLLVMRTVNTKDPAGNLASYYTSVTAAPLACAAFGFILLVADYFAQKRILAKQPKVQVLALMLTVLITGLVVTTLNTIVLRETIYASWKVLPFVVVWIPRVIEEILVGVVKVCLMALLMGAFMKQPSLKKLVAFEE